MIPARPSLDRRTFLGGALGIGALAGLGALAGCANAGSAPGTVRYWGMAGDGGRNEQKILDAFGQTASGGEVEIVKSAVPSNGTGDATSIITAVRGGNAPDVWWMDRFSCAQYASLGLLEPIDKMIEEFGDSVDDVRAGYLPFAINELTYNGELYGLPTETDTRALYFNRTLLRDNGIDPDELEPENGPPTVDRILEISEQLTQRDDDGAYTQLGLIPWDGEGWGITWALAGQASFFDDASCTIDLEAEPIMRAYEFLYDRAREMDFPKVDAFKATYEPPNHPPAQTSFFGGKQGFMISTPGFQFAMRKYVPDLDFGRTYLPVFIQGDDPYTWSGGFSLVCPKGSSLSRETWEFMKFYAGAEGQGIYAPLAYTLPTSLEVLENTTDPVLTDDLAFFIEQLEFSTSRPPFPVSQLWWDSMSQAQENVKLGSRTAAGALAAAQARVAPQMALNCPFTMPKGYGTVAS